MRRISGFAIPGFLSFSGPAALRLLLPLLALAVGACVQFSLGSYYPLRVVTGPRPPLTLEEGLKRGYDLLAEYEAYVQVDETAAEHFRQNSW